MIIPERIELTFELLKEVALANGQHVAPDIHITREEVRKVNGQIVKVMELRGTMKGVSFVYFGYYYVGTAGTIQFITYTANNLYEEQKSNMESLLNGFTILE